MPPSDGVEDGRPHLQADENNYTDLRFSCQYDNPLEGEGGPKIGTILPNVAATLFGDNDLTSSDDSSDENDIYINDDINDYLFFNIYSGTILLTFAYRIITIT